MTEMMEKVKDYTSSADIKERVLMDKLSEFLEVEKGGVKLYQAAIQQVRDKAVLDKFREFYRQTRKHKDILERLIRELGGDPGYMSPGARIAEEKASALLKTMTATYGFTPAEVELNAIENVIIAEIKDHADWELLGEIARRTADNRLGGLLKPAVSEVEPEEDEHLNWTREQMSRLAMSALSE